jgi:putative oxidoreductase
VASAASVTPAPRRGMSIALWVSSVLLAFFFAMMGLPKVLGLGGWAGRFAAWGYPPWFVIVVGVGEIGGAVLLLIPPLATPGAAGLSVIMLAAVATHLLHGESARVVVPLTLIALLILVAWGRLPGFRSGRLHTAAAASREQL